MPSSRSSVNCFVRAVVGKPPGSGRSVGSPGGRLGGGGPPGHLRADELFERAIEQAGPRAADAGRERFVHLHDVQGVVGDDDQVDEGVEGVLQQPAVLQDFVEQLHVLERDGQLPSQVVRHVDALLIVEVCGPAVRGRALRGHAFDHDRAQRAPPPAQRRNQHPFLSLGGNLRPLQAEAAGRDRLRARRDVRARRGMARLRRGGEHQLAWRGDGAATPTSAAHRRGHWSRPRATRARRQRSASPKPRARTRGGAPGCGGEARPRIRGARARARA